MQYLSEPSLLYLEDSGLALVTHTFFAGPARLACWWAQKPSPPLPAGGDGALTGERQEWAAVLRLGAGRLGRAKLAWVPVQTS